MDAGGQGTRAVQWDARSSIRAPVKDRCLRVGDGDVFALAAAVGLTDKGLTPCDLRIATFPCSRVPTRDPILHDPRAHPVVVPLTSVCCWQHYSEAGRPATCASMHS